MRAIRNSCSICMGSLKNPKVISCHHSFCSKCLDDYVRVKLRNGRFDCPLCRTSVELPKGGVSGFETNIYFESDLVDNFESTKLSNVKTPIRVLPEEEREKKETSQGMEARDKALNEELFKTRKQHQEANANAITKGTKLTQPEMEIQALRNQIADYVAQSQRTEARVKALEEGLSSTRKQYEEAKANSQGMEAKVKALNEELFKTRKQHEEANANSQRMEARVKALEEGLSSTRKQYEEAKANVEIMKKEREGKQIKAYRKEHIFTEKTDERIKERMCTMCQGWTRKDDCGFNCKCGGRKN